MIFDNLNGTKKARDQTSEHQNTHYDVVQAIATNDRVNCEKMTNVLPQNDVMSVPDEKWLMSIEEHKKYIKYPAKTIITRIICKHMNFFKTNFQNYVIIHIQHEYTDEMGKKSKIVSELLG